MSAKTGTAESFINVTDEEGNTTRVETANHSLVAYAPAEEAEYSMACMIPNAFTIGSGSSPSNLCLRITNELTKAIYNQDTATDQTEPQSETEQPAADLNSEALPAQGTQDPQPEEQ